MGNISDDYFEGQLVIQDAMLNIDEVLPMVSQLLALRKEYAKYCQIGTDEQATHMNGRIGVDFCNSELKKLLGIH
jgi:hypothetical protein